jgi:hypothetical protein
MKRSLLVGILFSTAVLIFGACGGGGGGGGGGGNLNSLFAGDYLMNVMEEEGGIETRRFPITADGAGNASSPATTAGIIYTVNTDRTMSIGPAVPNAFETSHGIINADGSFLSLTETFAPSGDIEFWVAAAMSSALTTTDLPGQYIIGQAGFNAGGFYTSQVLVTINAGGVAGSWEILAHSQGAPPAGNTGSLTIALTPGDGTLVINDGIDDRYGIMTPDANMMAIVDTVGSEVIVAVGVRKSTAGTPNGIGDYVINEIGLDAPATTPEVYTRRVDVTNGIGTFDYLVTADSLGGPFDSGSGITYVVSADGTVTFPSNSGWDGIISPDGEVMVLVDSDPSTAGEIHLGVAIKK